MAAQPGLGHVPVLPRDMEQLRHAQWQSTRLPAFSLAQPTGPATGRRPRGEAMTSGAHQRGGTRGCSKRAHGGPHGPPLVPEPHAAGRPAAPGHAAHPGRGSPGRECQGPSSRSHTPPAASNAAAPQPSSYSQGHSAARCPPIWGLASSGAALAGPTLPWTPTERHHRTHHQKSFPPSPAGVKTAQSAEQQNPQHTYYWQARGAAPHRLPPACALPTPGEVQGWRGHTVLQPRGPRQSPALGVSVTHDLLVRMALPRVPRPLRAALAQSEPPPHTTEVSWGSWGRARG